MRRWSRYLVGVVAMTGLLMPVTSLDAETCTLKMKRVDTTQARSSGQSGDHLARSTYPQTFFQQLGGPQGTIARANTGSKPKFSEVIKKEPAEYATNIPFRGVAALGSQHFGFVLDVAPPEKDNSGEQNENADKAEKSNDKSINFTRLYFDRNHNGDLTDDEVIDATSSRAYSASMCQAAFPSTELTIEVDGKKVRYAFTFRVYSYASSKYAYANASLNSAAYREGEIELDGKKQRVVLVDFNSNGRFDDAASVDARRRTVDGVVYPTVGDILYLDPQTSQGYRNPYDPTSGKDRHQVGKLVNIDSKFFDLKIDPSGETLSLKTSSVPLGHVANPNKGYRAIVYGDQGMLEISPDDSGNAPLPAGKWKLLSYTIQQTETPKPNAEEDEKDQDKSIVEVLRSVLPALSPVPVVRPRLTFVSAQATTDFKPVTVVEGKTTEMRFGPPYTPRVDSQPLRDGQTTMSLSMRLIGSGGEVCSSLLVDGGRLSAPEFTICTPDGEEVATGKFKYG